MTEIRTELTAIKRNKPSRPCNDLMKTDYLFEGYSVLDWGCGRGDDVDFLKESGFDVEGYDPFYNDIYIGKKRDLVMSNYVLCVIPGPEQRREVILQMWDKVAREGCLSISTRSKREVDAAARKGNWAKYNDGWLTTKLTFQKGFAEDEIVDMVADLPHVAYIESALIDGSITTIRVVKRK